MSEEMLELTVDKFTFRVPKGLYYNDTGVWVRQEGDVARLGLSDFAQQRSGDMAFAEVKPVETVLKPGDEFASVETIKVNVILPSPVMGAIVEINTALEDAPELINQASYGKGWLVRLKVGAGAGVGLLDAPAYERFLAEEGAH